jgi:hypothetical protein
MVFLFRFLILASILCIGPGAAYSAGVEDVEKICLNCNLPAPDNVQITATTTSSLSVSWSSVPGAVNYLIKAKNLTTGNIDYSGTATALSTICTGLASATTYSVSVQAIDNTGCTSENAGSARGTTDFIIADDIVMQFTPNTPITIPLQIPVEPNVINVGIRYEEDKGVIMFEKFGLFYSATGVLRVHHDNIGSGGSYSGWQLGNGNQAPPIYGYNPHVQAQKIYVYRLTSPVPPSAFPAIAPDLVINVVPAGIQTMALSIDMVSSNSPSYELWYCNQPCSSGSNGEGGDRDHNTPPSSASSTTIVPNPFDDKVLVHFAPIADENGGQLRLLDANGRAIYSLPLSKNETSSTLYTDGLPNGLYLIRLETADKVETHKVIKAN